MLSNQLFTQPEHLPFRLEGQSRAAALLIHGFPGTPAEMRPLGSALNRAGWTVHGLLLPGFGADFARLSQYKAADWLAAVDTAIQELQSGYKTVLLIGYSMGGGLALQVAALRRPTGLVLLAPLWQTRGWFWASVPVFKRIFPKIKPFQLLRMDWSDPVARQGILNFLPGIDVDDPEVRDAIRNYEFPLKVIDEIRQVGKAAQRAASSVSVPTLVFQGLHDVVIRPTATRRLLQVLPGPFSYYEVPAGHDLIAENGSGYQELLKALLTFAEQISNSAGH